MHLKQSRDQTNLITALLCIFVSYLFSCSFTIILIEQYLAQTH